MANGLKKVFFDESVNSILSGFPGFIFCGFGVNKQPQEYRDLLNLDADMYISFCLEMLLHLALLQILILVQQILPIKNLW